MFYQTQPVKTQTQPLPNLAADLIKVRQIQDRLNHRPLRPEPDPLWSAGTTGAFFVPTRPLSRWVE